MPKKKEEIKKMTEDEIKIRSSVISIAVAVLSLFIFLSLLNVELGIIGDLIRKGTLSLFGTGSIVLVLILLVYSVIALIDDGKTNFNKLYITTGFIFMSLLVIFDMKNEINFDFFEKISNAIKISSSFSGGGIIGAVPGFILNNLLGKTGTYLFLIFIIIASFIVLTEYTVNEILTRVKKKLDNQKEAIKLKRKEKIAKIELEKEEIIKKDKVKLPTLDNFDSLDNGIKIEKTRKIKLPTLNSAEDTTNNNENQNDIVEIYQVDNTEENVTDIMEETLIVSDEPLIDEKEIFYDDFENLDHGEDYKFPPVELLSNLKSKASYDTNALEDNGQKIIETLKSFKIDTKLVGINVGPTITSYELEPPQGIKLSRIVSLSDNLALSLAAQDIRIEAPIPGKSVVGIEVPNKVKTPVLLREIIDSKEFEELDSKLPLPLGKDVQGRVMISELNKMPHLLVAGATGSGKSVCINTILISILYKASPEDVKLMLIDPKVVELNIYNGIPHLLIPVVTDAKKASMALDWAVKEMENRYKLFAEKNVRDVTSYNNIEDEDIEKLPMIVIIIDELADLMMVAAKEVENSICRLAQMARAAGLYLIIATQRPSVDVITGIIKANIPSRISFAVSSQIDSRTILDGAGAEKLLGKGDMLFYPSFLSKPVRVQGAFVSDKEVENIVDFVKMNNNSDYVDTIEKMLELDEEIETEINNSSEEEPLLREAIEIAIQEGQVSISYIQRRLKIGYNRSANIVEKMEEMGIVSESDGSKPRKVLVDKSYLEK